MILIVHCRVVVMWVSKYFLAQPRKSNGVSRSLTKRSLGSCDIHAIETRFSLALRIPTMPQTANSMATMTTWMIGLSLEPHHARAARRKQERALLTVALWMMRPAKHR